MAYYIVDSEVPGIAFCVDGGMDNGEMFAYNIVDALDAVQMIVSGNSGLPESVCAHLSRYGLPVMCDKFRAGLAWSEAAERLPMDMDTAMPFSGGALRHAEARFEDDTTFRRTWTPRLLRPSLMQPLPESAVRIVATTNGLQFFAPAVSNLKFPIRAHVPRQEVLQSLHGIHHGEGATIINFALNMG